MKVAIIGAGIAGLACAFELKKYGIIPDIYEKRPAVGHPLEHTITTLNLFNNSMADPLKRFKKGFNISLSPLYILNEVNMKGPSKETTIKGKLGYVFKRGVESYSLENQIEKLVNLPIKFDSFMDIGNIKNSYDDIVVATGDDSIARHMGIWTESFNVYTRVATVLGSFNIGTMNMWINKDYCKSCYCYLLPNSDKEACMVFTINDTAGDDMEYHWKNFLYTEEIQYQIIETRDCMCNLGYPEVLKTPDNIYFVGNSGGFMDDFLGFGIFGAIESGIYAARSIACGKKYTKLTQELTDNVKKVNEYREAFNSFENEDIDRLLSIIDIPGIKQAIYRNPFFKARNFSIIPKLFNKIK